MMKTILDYEEVICLNGMNHYRFQRSNNEVCYLLSNTFWYEILVSKLYRHNIDSHLLGGILFASHNALLYNIFVTVRLQ